MTSKSSLLLLATLAVATALLVPAATAGKKKGAAAGGDELPMSAVAPLTASECERLGGTVIEAASNTCRGTGKACYTSTRKNGDHWVCITEAN